MKNLIRAVLATLILMGFSVKAGAYDVIQPPIQVNTFNYWLGYNERGSYYCVRISCSMSATYGCTYSSHECAGCDLPECPLVIPPVEYQDTTECGGAPCAPGGGGFFKAPCTPVGDGYQIHCQDYHQFTFGAYLGDCSPKEEGTPPFGPGWDFWETIGRIETKRCPSNPDTTTDSSRWYLPKYGDTLCYTISATRSMQVRVVLKTSTYKGMAMNAPVPAGDDSISDMVPILQDTSWHLDSTRYESNRSCFFLRRWFKAKEEAFLFLRVLDYAAEGTLTVYHPLIPWYPVFSGTIPLIYERFRSSADPDSDGLTVWEEYRGFCCTDDSHFRLDLDTTAANTRRQIIIIDNSCLLHETLVDGFASRLQEMMTCSLVEANCVLTSPVEGGWAGPYDAYERIDTYQADWFAPSNSWVPFQLTNPHYSHPAPADSSDLERSSDQVAIRLGIHGEDYGRTFHDWGDPPDWCYGICGNAGVGINLNLVQQRILEVWWPDGSGGSNFLRYDYPQLLDSVFAVCERRTVAHEFGHVIDVGEHDPQDAGNDKMCVMLNEMLYTYNHPRGSTTAWWWNDWWAVWRDIPSNPYHRWGFKDDDFDCASDTCYRP